MSSHRPPTDLEEVRTMDTPDPITTAAQNLADAFGMTTEEAAEALVRAATSEVRLEERPLTLEETRRYFEAVDKVRLDRLDDVDLDGQPAPARLERVIGPDVDPTLEPELYADTVDEDLIDRAVRLAQGDVIDGLFRTNPTVLEALEASITDELAGAAIDAYRSVWRDLNEAGR